MNQPIRYIIAIRPPVDIIAEVKEMKQALKKAIGGFYNSVNSEAHITLFEFYAYDEHYPVMVKELTRAVGMLDPFELEFHGFNHFLASGAFYVHLTSHSSRSIIERCIRFRQVLSPEILSIHIEGWTEMFDTPHMTIGRRLQPHWIDIAYSLFKDFNAKFWCDSLAIRKFNDDRKQFDVVVELPMLGAGFKSGPTS
ncbi:2'-5' RNA ligase family protein [Dyadobacter sp. 676]|uniref:2'-5' RNA ligase family protein n=1 Tax=Dyadobacter sp. 676 TaxID=3088362 RepID=A0AAU8FTN2_9BACT